MAGTTATAGGRSSVAWPHGDEPVVGVRGAMKSFPGDGQPVRALRGVDMEIRAGEFVCLMGPSGCGKSTLLGLIAGLDVPSGGQVVVAGRRLSDEGPDERARVRRRHVGIVFQRTTVLETMTVLDNVALAASIAGLRRPAALDRAHDMVDLLGLSYRAGHLPATLSGGELQRLAIARALANEPTVLLADEPTGSLDTAGGHEVLELFRRLHAEGQTILLVTHDADAAQSGDRIVRLRDGRVEPASAPSTVDA